MGQVTGLYFSPCGNVENIVRTMASAAAEKLGTEPKFVDFTRPMARKKDYIFGPEDLVFVGLPVYAGRLPNKIAPFIAAGIRGNGGAVPVVCFGNRSFDNALAELFSLLQQDGFAIPAAAAVVGQHAFTAALATGRPTPEDLEAARAFAVRAAEKWLDGAFLSQRDIPGQPDAPYYRPLGLDGAPADFLRATPTVDYALCNHCGTCAAACPMGSIDRDDPGKTVGVCIKCQACVLKCRRGARSFTDRAFLSHRDMLERDYAHPAENVFIV